MAKNKNYLRSCRSNFWKEVFEKELEYLKIALKGYSKILSIGCGPAIIERGLQERGFDVTGLDVSKEALEGSPDNLRTIVGSAEQMNIPNQSFDAVIYVASLQFIDNYKSAILETVRVLKPKGRLIVMLLNPKSEFFIQRTKDVNSYMNKIKHRALMDIKNIIRQYFSTQSQYFLGIKGDKIFESSDIQLASIYVINGIKK